MLYRTEKAESSFFNDMVGPRFNPDAVLDIRDGKKVLITGDFHMGSGRRDDLAGNGELLTALLSGYYFERGWHLVLNGDIEEMMRYSLEAVQKQWPRLYRVFDRFAGAERLYKLIGNHDEDLLFHKSYPYALHSAVRIETGIIPVYVYHGHQSSRVYTEYNNLVGASIRYFLKPFGIRNISTARSSRRRFYVERKAYGFSLENNCISVIGHTHRPLFESLGRFDYIKFEIERLCRDYPAATPAEKEKISGEVTALSADLGKLRRKERRDVLRQSLYGDTLPVPCLFNAGCAIGKKGINAIELDRDSISLVYWFTGGNGKHFISRGGYPVESMGPHRRAVLNQDRLDYVAARIELLGKRGDNSRGVNR
ncbi:MAG: serine/threonine protein phosphatase [Treponema sp.]|jgi:predicted phosphodiesterase|nr:serine/threonine protein phosphatase [Treponema sp.]